MKQGQRRAPFLFMPVFRVGICQIRKFAEQTVAGEKELALDGFMPGLLHERFPAIPRIALTATADERTRAEIIMRLDLAGARQFIAGFDRRNIRYRIALKTNPRAQLLRFPKAEHAECVLSPSLYSQTSQPAAIVYGVEKKASVGNMLKLLRLLGKQTIHFLNISKLLRVTNTLTRFERKRLAT